MSRTATLDDVCEVTCVHPQAVQAALTALPDDECVSRSTAFLKLVADPTRLKILSALSATELCVCDLAAVVGSSESAISHQLRLLRTGRVVTYRKQGRIAYYRLLDQHVTTLIENALEHARE